MANKKYLVELTVDERVHLSEWLSLQIVCFHDMFFFKSEG